MIDTNSLINANYTPFNNNNSQAISESSFDAASRSEKDKQAFLENSEAFLNIFLAQLKHQDPTAPMESTEFIDSISRISAVEQSFNTNQNLEKMVKLMEGERTFGNPVSYLGKDVEYESGEFMLKNGKSHISYLQDKEFDTVSIVIKDIKGNTVYTSEARNRFGTNKLNWDGTDISGNQLDDGQYKITIVGLTKGQEPQKFATRTRGMVEEAGFKDGEIELTVNGKEISIDNIYSIRINEDYDN